jgi:hypothetical protein
MSASIDRETVGSGLLEQTGYRAGRLLGRAEVLVRRLPTPRPWMVLGALVLASWGIAAEVGRIAQHDGWYYYAGADDTWYYTTAWAIAHGHVPLARIGYGYSLLLVPIARAAGPDMIDGLRSIIFFNQLVLAPIALLCIYGITRSFASRRYAYAVTLLWVVFPVLVIHYFLADYHSRYVDVTLPSALGLTALGDFPSMVALLVSAYFALRLISTRADLDAVAAGLAAGVAITIKPANLLFLPAPAIALAVARRPRGLAIFAAALVPALIGLTIWKYRGLGYLPATSSAAGTAPFALVAPLAFAGLNLHKYVQLNWTQLQHNLDGLREYTWSQRTIYFTAIGGFVGLARRALPVAALAGAWIGSYVLVKGSSTTSDIYGGDFLTHLIAAFPGYFLLVVSLPFLIPIYGRRRPPAPVGPASPRRLPLVACVLLGAMASIGIVVVASLPQLTAPAAAQFQYADRYVPLNAFPLSAHTAGGTVTLAWPLRTPAGTRGSFALFRDTQDQAVCTPRGNGATECDFDGIQVGATTGGASSITDRPPPGRWTYRVALSETPLGPQAPSDYVLVSTPVTLTVRR